MSFNFSSQDLKEMEKLATLVRTLNTLGHNPATSGNYSLRSQTEADTALISESGIDKSRFEAHNFIPLNYKTRQKHADFSNRKSSDETDIHLAIYEVTQANCVLHSHMLDALLFADLFPNQDFAVIKGLELLKGFKGITTHELEVSIPCFENTQDIRGLSEKIKPAILAQTHNYGILLRGHGLYAWGESVDGAKRHLEVFEYIFKYYLNSRRA